VFMVFHQRGFRQCQLCSMPVTEAGQAPAVLPDRWCWRERRFRSFKYMFQVILRGLGELDCVMANK